MCGFVGFFKPNGLDRTDHQSTIQNMLYPIHHRGPDDQGIWHDKNDGIILGHQRLSIFDLSYAGHQPMTSACDRYIIAYNGEIYNFQTLKKELEKIYRIKWKGHSDTEVLINAISLWGLEKALEKCVGMFAFSLWDKFEKKLHLVRDRVGEKPLYYGWNNGVFYFGSDLKSFTLHPNWNPKKSIKSIELYFKYTHIPAPFSIYEYIYKALPAEIITLDTKKQEIKKSKYWRVDSIGINEKMTPSEAIEKTHTLLKNSISSQMAADVPVGCFLSGGIDSSLVSAIMQSQSTVPIHTFTIGFEEENYNEAPYALEIAKAIGSNHHEVYLSKQAVIDSIQVMPEVFTEPFSDSSQIPTYLVSKAAKENVTVSLSGDGGDELFGGYTRYNMTLNIWKKTQIFPIFFRKIISEIITSIPKNHWDRLLSPFMNYNDIGQKAHAFSNLLKLDNMMQLYDYFISNSHHKNILNKYFLSEVKNSQENIKTQGLRDLMLHDFNNYLPNDILCKVDRTAMYNSLETRVPILDHRLIEFSRTIPEHILWFNNQPKWILKEILKKYVPEKLFNRKKMGFGIPISKFIRNELRDWGQSQMEQVYKNPLFDKNITNQLWNNFLEGNNSLTPLVWSMLVFEAWKKHAH